MSQTYRFYCLDSDGRLHNADWFEADNDEHAVQLIEAAHPESKCEIWLGERLVAQVTPERLSA